MDVVLLLSSASSVDLGVLLVVSTILCVCLLSGLVSSFSLSSIGFDGVDVSSVPLI